MADRKVCSHGLQLENDYCQPITLKTSPKQEKENQYKMGPLAKPLKREEGYPDTIYSILTFFSPSDVSLLA